MENNNKKEDSNMLSDKDVTVWLQDVLDNVPVEFVELGKRAVGMDVDKAAQMITEKGYRVVKPGEMSTMMIDTRRIQLKADEGGRRVKWIKYG